HPIPHVGLHGRVLLVDEELQGEYFERRVGAGADCAEQKRAAVIDRDLRSLSARRSVGRDLIPPGITRIGASRKAYTIGATPRPGGTGVVVGVVSRRCPTYHEMK